MKAERLVNVTPPQREAACYTIFRHNSFFFLNFIQINFINVIITNSKGLSSIWQTSPVCCKYCITADSEIKLWKVH